jgi:hypothetical protein
VQVKDHAVFQRRGADLIMKKEVRARRAREARAMRAKPGRQTDTLRNFSRAC